MNNIFYSNPRLFFVMLIIVVYKCNSNNVNVFIGADDICV